LISLSLLFSSFRVRMEKGLKESRERVCSCLCVLCLSFILFCSMGKGNPLSLRSSGEWDSLSLSPDLFMFSFLEGEGKNSPSSSSIHTNIFSLVYLCVSVFSLIVLCLCESVFVCVRVSSLSYQ